MRQVAGLVGFGLAALAASATGAVAGDTRPGWRHRPTPEQLLAVWPHQALERGVDGKAVISCSVSVQGGLYDCKVVSETPPQMGFGAAAIALTPQFLMTPKLHDGVPVTGGVVTIPINFSGLGGGVGSHVRGGPAFDTIRMFSSVPWLEAPTYAQVVAAYPAKARDAKVGGHATLNCRFDGQGRLTDCDVLTEDPAGMGFGKAARSLVRDFMAPRTDDAGASLKGAGTQIAFTFAPQMLNEGVPVIGKPHWARLPEASSMAAAYPPAAVAAHVLSGHVTLSCMVGTAGRLSDCSVERQDPAGMGFDKAALALSTDFQVSIWTSEGLPTVGGRIGVPLRYDYPAEEPASPPAAPPPQGTR
jgi:TonB family protein